MPRITPLVVALPLGLGLATFTGCMTLLGVNDVTEGVAVHGRVRGLWDGSEGVVLRLNADGVDQTRAISADTEFDFDTALAPGTPYAVTVVTQPTLHTCTVSAGQGVASAGTTITVACAGPLSIQLSGVMGWTFDPTQDVQMFDGSILVEDVALTITGNNLRSATVNAAAVTPGEVSPAIALPLGPTAVPVALVADGGLSKTYQLVFNRGAATLDQVVYGKASNTAADAYFGTPVALSGDTLVVGADGEDGASRGINGRQDNHGAPRSGAVYVFVRTGTAWVQQAYLKASNAEAGDGFGAAVAMSGDTLAVGARHEASAAPGVNGDQNDDGAPGAGAVYVFVRTGTTWAQQAYIKAFNPEAEDDFGVSVAVSGDTLAVGAPGENSTAGGTNGMPDDGASDSGAVYVFARAGTTWTQQAYLKAANAGPDDGLGISVALSGDTLVAGAPFEDGSAKGTNGQPDELASDAGSVYAFVRTGTAWTQTAYLKAASTKAGDNFGKSVALATADGATTLAVGAWVESSSAIGVNGSISDDRRVRGSGAAYVFVGNRAAWTQQAFIKASNPGIDDNFGRSIALFADKLVVGAFSESSSATGVNGNQGDNGAMYSGAAYVFLRTGATWTQQAYVKASNTDADDSFGYSVAVSRDAVVVSAIRERSTATGINADQSDNNAENAGAVYIFR
jgi:hypothetical protein